MFKQKFTNLNIIDSNITNNQLTNIKWFEKSHQGVANKQWYLVPDYDLNKLKTI